MTTTEIRRFTPAGVSEFEARLKLMKSGLSADMTSLVDSPIYTEVVGQAAAPDLPHYELDREAVGIYLNVVFARLNQSISGIDSDVGLWTWLSAKYFDLLCPVDQGGNRKVGDISRYVFAAGNFQKYYRHLLYGPYRIVRSFKDNLTSARVVLSTPVSAPGEAVEQIASRQEFISNVAMLGLGTRLYIDPETNKLKKGSGANGPGTPRRFGRVLAQLDRTWDTENMATEQLLELLPAEFDRFR